MNSYPWFIDNWLGSRTRMTLSPLARCVYRELLDQCWKHGSLPKDHEILSKMALVSAREFRTAWNEIQQLFVEKNGEFHHETVDEKRPQLVEYKRNRSESGRKGAQAKLQAKLQAKPEHSQELSQAIASGVAQAPIPIPINTPYSPPAGDGEEFDLEPPTAAPEPPTPKRKKASVPSEWFEEFWALYPRREAKGGAEKAFAKAVDSEKKFQALMTALRKQLPGMKSNEARFRKLPVTWLNNRCWEDDIEHEEADDHHEPELPYFSTAPRPVVDQGDWDEILKEIMESEKAKAELTAEVKPGEGKKSQ